MTHFLSALAEAREETDRLFAMLRPEAIYERPIAQRHRILFYVGHLEAFDWNLLRGPLGLDSFAPAFDRLFAFGIDPIGEGLPDDQPEDWPWITEVEAYRQRARQDLDSAIAGRVGSPELHSLLHIALEHRLMHAETLEYLFHQLPYDTKIGPSVEAPPALVETAPESLAIPAGEVVLGADRNGAQFGWDNEFEATAMAAPSFSIDKFKVTHGDYLRFVQAGGYAQRELWSSVDWDWRVKAGIDHPAFWVPVGDRFEYRGMFEQIDLPLHSPVYVSHAEASAYANWLGKALPTEAQWQRAAVGAKPAAPARTLWDPPPAGQSPELCSDFGVEDLYGSGWEWTATTFAPFPGFRAHPAYPSYSADFFDGKHFVLKGGSPRTAASMLRPSFRNWFQAHYPYVYAGFRCVTRETEC